MSGRTYWRIDAIGYDGKTHFFMEDFDRAGVEGFLEDSRHKYRVIHIAEYKGYINVGLSTYKEGRLIYQYKENDG